MAPCSMRQFHSHSTQCALNLALGEIPRRVVSAIFLIDIVKQAHYAKRKQRCGGMKAVGYDNIRLHYWLKTEPVITTFVN